MVWNEDRHRLQDVQNMTCDHNCVISTGLMSARVKRVCKAVMNDVISRGEGAGGVSENTDCRGGLDEEVRAREKVCLKDEEKPLGDNVPC